MDMQMPRMGGLEAAAAIVAREPSAPRPWIIALTANASVGDQAACRDAGMDDFLSKPIRIDQLAAALARAPSARLPEDAAAAAG